MLFRSTPDRAAPSTPTTSAYVLPLSEAAAEPVAMSISNNTSSQFGSLDAPQTPLFAPREHASVRTDIQTTPGSPDRDLFTLFDVGGTSGNTPPPTERVTGGALIDFPPGSGQASTYVSRPAALAAFTMCPRCNGVCSRDERQCPRCMTSLSVQGPPQGSVPVFPMATSDSVFVQNFAPSRGLSQGAFAPGSLPHPPPGLGAGDYFTVPPGPPPYHRPADGHPSSAVSQNQPPPAGTLPGGNGSQVANNDTGMEVTRPQPVSDAIAAARAVLRAAEIGRAHV